jgi:hypothetical protein
MREEPGEGYNTPGLEFKVRTSHHRPGNVYVNMDFIDRGEGTKLLHRLKLLDLSKLLFLSSMYSMEFLLLFQMLIHKIMPGSSVLRQQAGPEMIALK